MPKRMVRFRGIKATPKTLEKDLLEKSAKLAENPGLLIPKCEAQCRKCRFDKQLKKMEKVANHRDDAEELQSLATHGDQLVRAYAATISLAASGKVPFLTTKKLPSGDISFAVRGKVDPERLIGVQYFDDPDLRLLAFWQEARDDDLHIYSTNEGLFCADVPRAPASFVREMLAEAPYELAQDGSCGHPDSPIALRIQWTSAKQTLSICSDCVADVKMLQHLCSRIAARDHTDDFSIDVKYQPKCASDCPQCALKLPFKMSQKLLDSYRNGAIDDATLVEKYVLEREESLRASGEEIYIAGQNCYGKNKEKFIENLKGGEAERFALASVIRAKGMAVVSASDQAGKIIIELWPEKKEELMMAVAPPEIVKAVMSLSNLTPPQMIAEAKRLQLAKSVHARLPEYSHLGPVGSVADSLARAYKTEGKGGMVRTLEKAKAQDHRAKAVAYGFLQTVGEGEGHNWQYTKEERDFGVYLAQFAKTLLESEENAYDEALRQLLTASGASEEPRRKH